MGEISHSLANGYNVGSKPHTALFSFLFISYVQILAISKQLFLFQPYLNLYQSSDRLYC